MKSGKSKLITIIFAFILSISALTFGVYAAFNASLAANGKVKFNAYGIDVDVDSSITGAVGTDITTTYAGTTNKTRQPSKNLISSTPWNFGNLSFDQENAMSLNDLVVTFEFKITNYSSFPIEASVTVPSISGILIEKQNLNYSYSYDSIQADEKYVTVKFKPASLETAVNLTNLNLTLNISKTLKKETDITKFKWGTPANGTISITGNNLTETDTNIIIPRKNGSNKVNVLGNNAFQSKSFINIVIIPNGIISIGDFAFQSCSALTSVTIPNSVISIGSGAFQSCRALTSVTIPNNVTSVGNGTFASCRALTSLSIGSGVTSIGYEAFRDCIALIGVIIPNSVTSIGFSAFRGCSALTGVTIPSRVTSIFSSAFDECSALLTINVDSDNTTYSSDNGVLFNKDKTKIELCPGGKTSYTIPNSVTSIGYSAFMSCRALSSVTIGSGVTSIENFTFSSCSALLAIYVDTGNTTYSSDNGVLLNKNKTTVIQCPKGKTSYIIPNSVINIENSAFESCSKLTSLSIGSGVTSIGNSAFFNCSALFAINVAAENTTYSSDNGVLLDKNKTMLVQCPGGKTSYVIPNTVNFIDFSAFSSCSALTSLSIGSGITSINSNYFSNCSALLSINVDAGNTIYSSDNGVLLNKNKTTVILCPKGKTSYTIPSTVTSIGESAFNGCSALASITIANSVTSIGDSAFNGCSAFTSITIANSVTNIGNSAFSSCSALTSITIANSVTSIGNSAFSSCSALTSITIPNRVTSIGDSTFNGCSALTSIIIPNSVTSIGSYAFSSCSALNNITIPNSVTSIGDSAFSYCSALTNITIPNSVTSIGNSAFSYSSALTAINVDTGNTTYSSDNGVLFNKNKTTIILCPGGKTSYAIANTVTSIGGNAFSSCSALTSITIPNSVTSIGDYAFATCNALASVYFERTTTFTSLGSSCFSYLKNGSVLYFKNQTVMNQFEADNHYTSSNTTKALY